MTISKIEDAIEAIRRGEMVVCVGPQGAEVFIYLAHDIDFRDIYQLERVR